jgi:hypothetical protein
MKQQLLLVTPMQTMRLQNRSMTTFSHIQPVSTVEIIRTNTDHKETPQYTESAQDSTSLKHQKDNEDNDVSGGAADTPNKESSNTITINYDNDEPPTIPSSKDTNANRQFLSGLDEIDKFFESVFPPDELDVGANGSSMQDVLVGTGIKILLK